LEFIEAVSNQAALALESARLLDETQRQVEREQTLNILTQKFSQTLDFETLVQTVVRELGQLPRVTTAAIHLTTGDNEPDTLKLTDDESS
jgi:GAF domain-containing protein